MKQNITLEQLQELSPEAKEKMRKWWINNCSFGLTYCMFCERVALTVEGGVIDTCYSKHEECELCKQKRSELGDFAKERGLIYNESGDVYRCTHNSDKKLLPLFSIGQMIEFLGENYIGALYNHSGNAILLKVKPENICDVLWEAVKNELSEVGE